STHDNQLSNHLLQLCLYLGRRDFVDHVERIDPVVWVQLACAFRYGREDLDVIGISFRKDIWIKRIQMYPFEGTKPPNTPMQDALLKKAGDQGHPFTFDIPVHLPCSVSLQPAPEDAGKPCGVDYEVKFYSDSNISTNNRDTCRLIIRKIQYAQNELAAGPKTDLNKQFITADKPIHVEASMEKELYYHGDPIPIKVKVNNETSKVVKKIKISIQQITDVLLYSSDKYHKCVLNEEFGDQINANSTFEKEYRVTPLLANNKEKRGLALDGKLKDEDTNLASSTMENNKRVPKCMFDERCTLKSCGCAIQNTIMSERYRSNCCKSVGQTVARSVLVLSNVTVNMLGKYRSENIVLLSLFRKPLSKTQHLTLYLNSNCVIVIGIS
uniref:Arrestin-C n=1 Tax=Sinocyclocheilus rhinocerous TaxID=307959 RepID=A0A673KWB8_9TELE